MNLGRVDLVVAAGAPTAKLPQDRVEGRFAAKSTHHSKYNRRCLNATLAHPDKHPSPPLPPVRSWMPHAPR